jgi:mitochondrial fission 1 protein
LYYLALGHYKMGNYDEAKSFNCESPSLYFPLFDTDEPQTITVRLLEKEPTNMQAQSLDTLIEKAVKRGMLPTFHFPQAS